LILAGAFAARAPFWHFWHVFLEDQPPYICSQWTTCGGQFKGFALIRGKAHGERGGILLV